MSIKYENLVDLAIFYAKTIPEKKAYIALSDGEIESGSLTYGELHEKAAAIASYLQSLNLKGERALLVFPAGLDFVTAFFGCLYGGMIGVPIYLPFSKPDDFKNKINTIISNAQPKIILTTKEYSTLFEKFRSESPILTSMNVINTSSLLSEWLSSMWQRKNISPKDLAFLQYTSGSTRSPKGVMVTHNNIIHNSEVIKTAYQHSEKTIVLSWLPHYHDMGLIGPIVQALYVGGTAILMAPMAFLQQPIRWLKAISKYGAHTSGAPNFAYELCSTQINEIEKSSLDLKTWTIAYNGSEPIRQSTLEKFASAFACCGFRKEAFYPCYGLAESTLFVTGSSRLKGYETKTLDIKELEKNRVKYSLEMDKSCRTFVSSGCAWIDQQIVIVNSETLLPCESHQVGEVWVKSQSIAKGYWMNPEASVETFEAYIAKTHEGPFLRTGDLGFVDEGQLYLTGRLKEVIIIRGSNYYPQDIEQSVQNAHAAFAPGTGAAFSVTMDEEEKLVFVQEILRTHLRNFDSNSAIATIRRVISELHGIEVHAIVLIKPSTLPRTSSGKIQRLKAKNFFLGNELQKVTEWVQPNRSLSESNKKFEFPVNQSNVYDVLIAKLAEKVNLPIPKIDCHLPFSFYGLDSAKAVAISGELEKIFQRSLPPTLLYEYPTIHALAQFFTENHITLKATPNQKHINHDPIAIIGMGLRFPQANSPESLWALLQKGCDTITKALISRTGESIPSCEHWGGFLSSVDLFDAEFFSISPREANHMDPQQRLLLEVAWEALENANITPSKIRGTETGVYLGLSSNDYGLLQLGNPSNVSPYSATGSALSVAANRLSYFLGLHGPSLVVDTACSSSLVSLHLACSSLQQREIDLALVGGANLILSSQVTSGLQQAGMLAKDGRCKTFDASADGYVRGEGCGIVVLKRLSDAIADKDCISAVILGSAVNQDGLSNGLTAPNGFAQRRVIQQALSRAGVAPEDVSYIEAHGTGTSLGDPIEVSALVDVLMRNRNPENPCWMGSIKTNMGHLEAAAGIAGLIKVVLALKNKEIPGNLHFNTLNPYIRLENVPLYIPKLSQPWISAHEKRIAGVSSFGFGGTNGHAVIAEAPKVSVYEEKLCNEQPIHVLTISGKGEEALHENARNFKNFIDSNLDDKISDICYTANMCRTHFSNRLALVVQSKSEIQDKLEQFLQRRTATGICQGHINANESAKIAFLFTGQGSQYVGMGSQLYKTYPIFREIVDHCELLLKEHAGFSLLEKMHSLDIDNHLLNETIYTQPVLFVLEYALAMLWSSYGVKPEWIMGHSLGEYAAACFAGVFNLEEGLQLVAARGRLMQGLSKRGKMVVVFTSEQRVLDKISNYSDRVSIAGLNCPEQVVISGEEKALEAICDLFLKEGIRTKYLLVSHAFHSPLMEPMIQDFYQIADQINYQVPKFKFISNTNGKLIETPITAEYWCKHLRHPIKFNDGMTTLGHKNCEIFVEIGPHPTLLGMGRLCLPDSKSLWLPSLRRGRSDLEQMAESICELYTHGASIDFGAFDKNYFHKKVALPTYAFQRQRYWLEASLYQPPYQHNRDPLLKDNFYEIQWILQDTQSVLKNDNPPNEMWILFCDQQGVGLALAEELEKQQRRYIIVYEKNAVYRGKLQGCHIDATHLPDYVMLLNELSMKQANIKIVYLWHLDLLDIEKSLDSSFTQQVNAGAGILNLLRVCKNKQEEFPSLKLWVVTQKAIPINAKENHVSIMQSPIWGLGKTASLEHPEIWGGLIDVDWGSAETTAQSLLNEIERNDLENQVILRKEGRHVARLIHSNLTAKKVLEITKDATYLVTGGLGALGLQVSKLLIQKGARSLILVSRRGVYTKELQIEIDQLQQNGTTIVVIKGDISVEEDVTRIFKYISKKLPILKGVIHAAGISGNYQLLENLDIEQLTNVLSAKIKGGWFLHQHTKEMELDFFVNFSSITSVWGSKGQGHYAAANQFLDILSHYRRVTGLCGLSINWGPWADGGMLTQEWNELLNQTGIELLEPQEALASLNFLLSTEAIQIAFVKMNWAVFKGVYEMKISRPFLKEITISSRFAEEKIQSKRNHELIDQLNESSQPIREKILTNYLEAAVKKIMKWAPEKSLDYKRGFFQMGMDSIMTLELVRTLEADLGTKLATTTVFNYPTIGALSKYLASETSNLTASIAPKENPSKIETDILLLDQLNDLSEQDAASLLLNKLETIENR